MNKFLNHQTFFMNDQTSFFWMTNQQTTNNVFKKLNFDYFVLNFFSHSIDLNFNYLQRKRQKY